VSDPPAVRSRSALSNPILWKFCLAPAVAVALCSIGTVLALAWLGQGFHIVFVGAVASSAIVAGVLSLGLASWIGSTIVSRVRSAKAAADSIAGGTGAALAPSLDADGFESLDASLKRLGVEVRHIVDRLQAESTRTAAILGSMVEGVLAVDEQLRITFCNGSFRRTLGIGDGLVEGAPLRTVCRDSGLIDLVNRVLHSRKQAEERLRIHVDERRVFDVGAAPLGTVSPSGVLVILHDVTELERLERVRKDFVGNVSHELRTPLAAILGYAETLLEGALEDKERNRQFVDVIRSNAVRLTNITGDLLTLSTLDTQPSPALEPVSVLATLSAAVKALEFEARGRQVAIVMDQLQDAQVLAERVRLEQVFLNLLANAIKFNKPQGEVRVNCQVLPDQRLQVTIRDTGLGIPSQDLTRIFERFYRVDQARSRSVGGTGLGLAIVKHAVESFGGVVSVESQLGKGSAFTVTLPVVKAS
jgi:two-component system phosphate regulon sensor histidine kinase PhoR